MYDTFIMTKVGDHGHYYIADYGNCQDDFEGGYLVWSKN